jgi:hypothetical protein
VQNAGRFFFFLNANGVRKKIKPLRSNSRAAADAQAAHATVISTH